MAMTPQGREDLLKHQKDLFNTAIDRKGQRAQHRPTRHELEGAYSAAQAAAAAETSSGVRQTVVGYSYPPCALPLTELKPITIDELRLEENHTGRVLFARTFGVPRRIQAVQGAIFDTTGDVDRIAVYNFETGLAPDVVLPPNSIIAVKQPYYKVTMDGGVMIRVDHPSDLVLLSDLDDRAPSVLRTSARNQDAMTWKTEGNRAFKDKDYRQAIDLYTGGLRICQDDDSTLMKYDLHRNRAIANIHLGRYEAGLADAEAAIMPNVSIKAHENNIKACYRAGCAAYQLGDFSKAKSSFTSILETDPTDPDAIRELKRTRERLYEERTGDYCFEKMAGSVSTQHNRLDHADFTTKVEPRASKVGGNGLFARTAISAGELVLCEKAFAVAYEKDGDTEQTVIINLNRDSASMGTHATRLVKTTHKMLHSPKQAAKLLTLYDGGYSPKIDCKLVNGVVPVDTFRVQAILESNGFGCPSTSTIGETDTDTICGSTGAWIMAAFINHDCIGNAQRAFIGDMMIVHATRDIAEDEEIFQRYKNPDDDNALFQDTLRQTWNFTCGCRLCVAERATPDTMRRIRIAMIKSAKAFMDRHQISESNPPEAAIVDKAEKLRAQVANSYDSTLFKNLPRLGLHDLDHWLCMAYILTGANNKVRAAGLAVLRDLGMQLTITKNKVSVKRPHCRPDVTGIHAATYIAAGYLNEGNNAVGDQLEALAKELYQIGYGTTHGYHSRSG